MTTNSAELNPVEPGALAKSIAELEKWYGDENATEDLPTSLLESIGLVMHELKRLQQLAGRTAAQGEQSKCEELFVELRESLRWALRRIEVSNLGQGELFRKADDVLARADAERNDTDEDAAEIGCGECGWKGKTAEARTVVPLGHPIAHHECPKCGKPCTVFYMTLEPLAGSAEQVSERDASNMLRRVLEWPNPNGTIEEAYLPPWLAEEARAALSAPERNVTDERIAQIWAEQSKYHGGEPCRVSHIEFARALLNQQGEQTAPEWISVKDRLPKTSEEVIVWREDSGPFLAKRIAYCDVEDSGSASGEVAWLADQYGWQEGREEPTHWMHLPAAPSTAQKDG